MKLEFTDCYNCGSRETSLYDKENGYTLVKCKRCGLLYVNPRPPLNVISEAAKTGLHSGDKIFDKTHSFHEPKIPRYLKILKDFYTKKELREKNWLDIGCGHGEFLFALEQYTSNEINAVGNEPNINKVKSALSRGLKVTSQKLSNYTQKYDYISTLDVFSHLPNPIETLIKWKSLINENGEILIETGHSSHLHKRFHNKPYDLPDHLSFANKNILINILDKCGFEVLNVKIYRGIFYRAYTLKNFAKEFVKFLIGKKNSFHSFFKPFQHGDMYIRAKKKY